MRRPTPRLTLFFAILAVFAFSSATPAIGQSFIGAAPAENAGLTGFGGALAVAGDDVLVGEGRTSLREGGVYVYRKNGDGDWAEALKLTGSGAEPGDGFGFALAVDGERLLVSAPGQEAGAAFVFEQAGGEWSETARFTSAAVGADGRFGASVALSGDWAFVGAPRHGDRVGAVVVFRRDAGGAWRETGILAPDNGESGDIFGETLAVRDGTLLVGAPARANGRGAVYAFSMDPAGTGWVPSGEIIPAGLDGPSAFGAALALSGDRAFIGAPGWSGATGVVFVFAPDRESGEWEFEGRYAAFDGGPRELFGTAVVAVDGEIWAGAPRASSRRGAVYVFRPDEPTGATARRIGHSDLDLRGEFGATGAVGETVAAIGLSGVDEGSGAVAIFERDAQGQWMEANLVASEPETLSIVTGGTLQCGATGRVADFECDSVELLSFLPVSAMGGGRGIRLNDVWGWMDPENGKEYALVGRNDGMAFVDVSDANNPVYVGQMYRTEGSPTATWRDMKVYRDHAFVVADASGAHGMQVFDLTRLREYAGEPITWEPDVTYDRIRSAHNIVMNEETGFAYAVGAGGGGETCGGGLHMIDVSDPLNPTFAGCFSDPQTGRGSTGYTHDAQCVVYRGPDQRYQEREICFGANETALSIADVTDKEEPVALSRAGYPNVAYSHQGWLTEDQRYFYMNDELDELQGLVDRTRTIIWDVSELDDPQLVGEYFAPVAASDHNLYIVGNLMYQSNYTAGLRIVDISEPLEPREVGYLDTAPFNESAPGFAGSWSNFPFFESGMVAVTSGREGLFLVRYAPGVPIP